MEDQNKLHENRPFRFIRAGYIKWTAYGLVILAFTLLQSVPHLVPEVFGARPLLLLSATVGIALFTGPTGGAAAGVACGLLWDVFSPRLLGFHALILLAVGCACGLLVRLMMRNNLLTALILTAGGGLTEMILDWFFNYTLLGGDRPFHILMHIYFPNMIYTLALTPLVYFAVWGITRLLRNRI